MMSRMGWAAILLILLLAGCGDAPTPLPVDLPPTTTPTLEAGEVTQSLPTTARILLDYKLDTALPDADRAMLEAAGVILENAPTNRMLDGMVIDLAPTEVFVRFENPNLDDDALTRSPNMLNRSVALNSAAPPFDQEPVRHLFWESFTFTPLDPRVVLAQAGYPDGFDLRALAVNGFDLVAYDLQMLYAEPLNSPVMVESVSQDDAQQLFNGDRFHLAIFSWGDPAVRELWMTLAGAENVIDMPPVSLLYQVGSGITVTEFTPGGFPIPRLNP